MDNKIVEALAKRDLEEARRLLAEVHREKTFLLADYYLGRDVMGEAARLHALHIALISLIYSEVKAGGLTGLDLALASSFAEARARCGRVEAPRAPGELADFYDRVAEELNKLLERLCSRS